jgi:hypothetical protein
MYILLIGPVHSLAGMLPVDDFEDVDLCLCRGFLIDGDHAIKWREGAIASPLDRSVCCNVFYAL